MLPLMRACMFSFACSAADGPGTGDGNLGHHFPAEFDGKDTFFGLVDGFELEWGTFSLSAR
jgi:hypothetical protein